MSTTKIVIIIRYYKDTTNNKIQIVSTNRNALTNRIYTELWCNFLSEDNPLR